MSTTSYQLQYNNIVFHHVPNSQAPGLLGAMLVFAFCLGVISLELVFNLGYDYKLIKRIGWKEPHSALNRLAYFLCRYGSFLFFLITLIFMNAPGTDCDRFAIAVNVMWVIPFIFVDLIFVQRTLAVYGWNMLLTVSLGSLYLIYVALCSYSVIKFGRGYKIPYSDFCAYQTFSTHSEPHATAFIVFFVIMTLLDTLVLLLTTHRLLEGGLLSLGEVILTKVSKICETRLPNRSQEKTEEEEESLKGLLLRQGIIYFLILEFSRFAFLIVYYTVNNNTSFQVLICGIIVLIGPLMAGMLFRQTSEAVRRTQYTKDAERGQVSSFGNCGSPDPMTNSFRPLLSMPSIPNIVRDDSINLVSSRRYDSMSSMEMSPKKFKSVENFGGNMSRKSSGSLLYNLNNEAFKAEGLEQVHVDLTQRPDIELVPVTSNSSMHHRSISQGTTSSPRQSPQHKRFYSAKTPYLSNSDHGHRVFAPTTDYSRTISRVEDVQDSAPVPFAQQRRGSSKNIHAHGVAR
ncbi:uncharacterized protein FA14DRAFT_173882 [Meira miltonrushii]|uniref:Uncharacterized protein n=1 Tax=Meira miltonrushii TaxID=1280837 RepID=A0A316V9K6_9BASI|nr:uncharacterized protein FA14DRAFT_173882 [Meira miltonrushii]PWN34180.1 hypothetical protein FA14DRAFT_173882 [Meira miltonrushii]